MIQSYKDLRVYQLSFVAAMEVFRLSKAFPKEELYSLTDQIRRSSRSISANLAEGWAKRHYENVFRRHVQEAIGSAHETKNWLDFAFECGYLTSEQHTSQFQKYEEICKMLYGLHDRWHTTNKDQVPDATRDN